MQSKLDTSKDQERKREKGKEREREWEGGSEFFNLGLTNQSRVRFMSIVKAGRS